MSFDKVKDSWFQTLGFFIKDSLLYPFEDLGDLISFLIDM